MIAVTTKLAWYVARSSGIVAAVVISVVTSPCVIAASRAGSWGSHRTGVRILPLDLRRHKGERGPAGPPRWGRDARNTWVPRLRCSLMCRALEPGELRVR